MVMVIIVMGIVGIVVINESDDCGDGDRDSDGGGYGDDNSVVGDGG